MPASKHKLKEIIGKLREVEIMLGQGDTGVTSIAAGAILAMLVDTMIPKATEATHGYSGLIVDCGFLGAFVLSKSGD